MEEKINAASIQVDSVDCILDTGTVIVKIFAFQLRSNLRLEGTLGCRRHCCRCGNDLAPADSEITPGTVPGIKLFFVIPNNDHRDILR
jgi:hypothetical protein